MIIHMMNHKNSDIIIINQKFITMTKSKQMNYDKQTLPTKLAIDDYNLFLILTKLEYEAGLINEKSVRITKVYNTSLNQLSNNQIYHYLEQEQEKLQNTQH